jgi:hypothetical protein
MTKELQHSIFLLISMRFYSDALPRFHEFINTACFPIASRIKFNHCDEVGAFFYHKLTSDSKPNRTTSLT